MPGRALYVVDTQYDDPRAYDVWLTATKPIVTTLLDARQGAVA